MTKALIVNKPLATHMIRCENSPMLPVPATLWATVCRSRRKPRKYGHWVFTHARTGKARYTIIAGETPTHWLAYGRVGRKVISRLSRKLWQPTWLVRGSSLARSHTPFYDARAIGDFALADAILEVEREDKPPPALPPGVKVPTLVKLDRPGAF